MISLAHPPAARRVVCFRNERRDEGEAEEGCMVSAHGYVIKAQGFADTSGISPHATVNGPSKVVRLITSVFATCGPCATPFGAKNSVPGV